MKVFVTGKSGQLGHDVCAELDRRGIKNKGVSSAELDITDEKAVHAMLTEYAPDAVIHCAAWTKVDAAEDEPERCFAVNERGAAHIAAACAALGAKMLYISTDYVFPGTGTAAYAPADATGPLSIYGKSKLAGERAVLSALEKYFIVRISWVFGVNGVNFVKTMLRLSETRHELNVVADQIGSPTYTADLAKLLCDMVETEKYGIYHASNEGFCSWADFAEEIFRLAGRSVQVNHIQTKDYPAKAPRPLNSRMSKDKLSEMGFARLPDWQDALARYIGEIL